MQITKAVIRRGGNGDITYKAFQTIVFHFLNSERVSSTYKDRDIYEVMYVLLITDNNIIFIILSVWKKDTERNHPRLKLQEISLD